MGLGIQRLLQGSFECFITAIWTELPAFTSDAVSKKYLMMTEPYLKKDYVNRFSRFPSTGLQVPQN